ncbi:MAG: hypothetical protein AAF756_22150 [Pseudomonadota bacterium]
MSGEVPYAGAIRALTHGWEDVAAGDYALFLAPHSFDWFATFTFSDHIHPEAADKAFRVWINKLNISLYGRKWRYREPQGVKWLRGLEWQKRGVLHYHVLLSGVRGAIASAWSDVWHVEMGMGFADIVLLNRDQEAVKAYVTKYVCKGGELDFSRNFERESVVDWINALSA